MVNQNSFNAKPDLKKLKNHKRYSSVCELMYRVVPENLAIKQTQGGYSDENYYYQAFIKRDRENNERDNQDIIVKSKAKTGELIKASEILPLNHANDITYNPNLNKLLVVHNNPKHKTVSFLDPETLTICETFELPCPIYCMDYNPKRDLYVVGCSGGQNFRFLDSKFQFASDIHLATPLTKGYVTQGVACDDDYIYFVLYVQNVITVYDWDGNFVCIIELDVGNIEPENISIVDGEIRIMCDQKGTSVFRVKEITPIIEEN